MAPMVVSHLKAPERSLQAICTSLRLLVLAVRGPWLPLGKAGGGLHAHGGAFAEGG